MAGDYAAAGMWLQKALQIYPDDLFTLVLIRQVYQKQGRNVEAEEILRNIQSRMKGGPLAVLYTGLGAELMRQGPRQKAVEVLEEAVALDPGLERAQYYLVILYHWLGQSDREEAHIRALEKIGAY